MLTQDQEIERRMRLLPLAIPIFIESALRTLFNSVDIFMVSRYQESAVGGVGAASQITFFLLMFYLVISMGSGIAIAQNLGAKKSDRAVNTAALALLINIGLGMVLSITFVFFGKQLMGIFNLPEEANKAAGIMLTTVSAFSVSVAGASAGAAVLRNYGHTRAVMFINISANILNVIGNYCFLYGPFGIPRLGIFGVALSTGISQTFAFLVTSIVLFRKVPVLPALARIFKLAKGEVSSMVNDILHIGLPSAGEFMSYNLSQIVITFAVATYMVPVHPESLNARVYLMTIINYLMLSTGSIGSATGTLVGYHVGAANYEKAQSLALRNLKLAMIISTALAVVLALASRPILGLFTSQAWILSTGGLILFFNIFQESGRAINLVIGHSIRGAGDARYILYLGLIGQWTVLVGLTFLFGVVFGFGLFGLWAAMLIDEWGRGIIMLRRWNSRRWIRKRLDSLDVKKAKE